MTNPRGFKRGHPKLGGRKRGTPNRIKMPDLRKMLKAAHLVGSDLNGKDGLIGYFKWVALSDPLAFLKLAPGMIDMEAGPQAFVARPPRTAEQLLREIEEFLGPGTEDDDEDADEVGPDVPWSWTGRGYPIGLLMHIAVLHPAAYCKGLAAFLPAARGRSRHRGRSVV
jgi:hypothetical protein